MGSSYRGTEYSPLVLDNFLNVSYYKPSVRNYNEDINFKDEILNMSSFLNDKDISFYLGGDHTVTISCVQNSEVDSLLWVDAHADFNNFQTSNTGHLHGMSLNMIVNNLDFINNKIEEDKTFVYGVQEFDKGEKELLDNSNVSYSTLEQTKNDDLNNILTCMGDKVHVSFDVDSLHPFVAPGVDVRENSGFRMGEAEEIFNFIKNSDKVVSADFVEFNPIKDRGNITYKNLKRLFDKLS